MNSKFLRWFKAAASVAAPALFTIGCATSTYRVKVDAIAQPSPPPTRSYTLKSKDPRLGEENLRYSEAAGFVKTALSGKGLYEAPNEDKADMIVEVEFGMDAPRSKVEHTSTPVYASVGGGVRYDSVPVQDSQGRTSFRTVAVYEPSRSQFLGYDEQTHSVTTYEKYLRVTARENMPASEGRPAAELWSIHASAEDESKDLRKYLPMMASAMVEYIGQDSTSQQTVRVKADGPGVIFIRKGMSDTPAATPVAPTAPAATK